MKRFREWLIPELQREPDEDRRRMMFKQTMVIAMGDWVMIFGLVIPILAPAIRRMESYTMRLGTLGSNLTGLLAAMVVINAWMALGIWFQRSSCRREVRQLMRSEGIAICVPCGYDLTGNASGRCPECGKSVAPTKAVKT